MADIVIRGMEMPPEGEYHMTLYVCNDGYAYFDVDTFQVDEDRFEAVPIPEGHGRIVDAAEVLEKANNSPWFDGDASELGLLLGSEVTTIVPAEGGTDNG